MAFNNAAVLSHLQTLCAGLAGVQAAQLGAPKGVVVKRTVYIGLGGFRLPDKVVGVKERTQRIMIFYADVLDGDEEATELAGLAPFTDAFLTAFIADRTLGGTCETADIDGSAADDPLYNLMAAEEVRLYPIAVDVKQRQSYNN